MFSCHVLATVIAVVPAQPFHNLARIDRNPAAKPGETYPNPIGTKVDPKPCNELSAGGYPQHFVSFLACMSACVFWPSKKLVLLVVSLCRPRKGYPLKNRKARASLLKTKEAVRWDGLRSGGSSRSRRAGAWRCTSRTGCARLPSGPSRPIEGGEKGKGGDARRESKTGLLKRTSCCNHLKHVASSAEKGNHHLQVAMFDRCIMHPDPCKKRNQCLCRRFWVAGGGVFLQPFVENDRPPRSEGFLFEGKTPIFSQRWQKDTPAG